MKSQLNLVCSFIQILIHVRSNMLENVIKILQDTVDRNVSVFVKRHVISEDVVSVPVLQVVPSARAPFRCSPGTVALRRPLQQEIRPSSVSPAVSGRACSVRRLFPPGVVWLLGFSGNRLLRVLSSALFLFFLKHPVPSLCSSLSANPCFLFGEGNNKPKRVTSP